MENSFEIGNRKFKIFKLDAFKQFHIVRRTTPILTEMLPVLKDLSVTTKNQNLSESEKFEQMAKILGPVMTGLSKLSDEDANKVLYGLLSAVETQQPQGGWAKVATESMLMMQDLELPTLLQIAGRAFAYNLSGFFSALPAQP